MTGYLVLTLFAVFAAATALPDGEKYTTKFDDMDVDAILQNKESSKAYMNCLLDEGKCTEAGEEMKKNIADALATKCAKCSAKQLENGKKVLKHLYEKDPEALKKLAAKYDPDGKYKAEFMELAKKQGYKL